MRIIVTLGLVAGLFLIAQHAGRGPLHYIIYGVCAVLTVGLLSTLDTKRR